MSRRLLKALALPLVLISCFSFAQDGLNRRTVTINSNCLGHLDYRPIGYTAGTGKYPLMVYLTGANSEGDGTNSATGLNKLFTGSGAPHEQQDAGTWVDAYTVNSQTYRFVIMTPQFVRNLNTAPPTPQEIDQVIDYAISSHPGRIDTTRIYLVGQSQGAGFVWEYPGARSRYANRLAAIMPFAGVSFPFPPQKADNIRNAQLPVWAFHNDKDNSVPPSFSIDYVKLINRDPAPPVQAKLTLFDAFGHQCWFLPLTRNYTDPVTGYNVYQWLLQYSRQHTTVFAGDDIYTEPSASNPLPVTLQLNGSGTGPNGSIRPNGISWAQVSGPSGGNFSNTGVLNPTVSNLVSGVYVFRLTIADNANATFTDDVTVTVSGFVQRIQAEDTLRTIQREVTYNEIFFNPTSSYSPGVKIEGIGKRANGVRDWMEYQVNINSTGYHTFRFRVGSPGSTSLYVKNASGTLLDTVLMYDPAPNEFMDLYAYNVYLIAGPQVIRIQDGEIVGSVGREWRIDYFDIFGSPAATPLPVSFGQFNVRCNNNQVDLVWTTAAERSLKEFRLQRSSNGMDWNTVYTLASANQTNGGRYSYTDVRPAGNQFYRVVAVDLDGRETLSAVARTQCGGRASVTAFPNPVKQTAMLSLYLEKNAAVRLSLYDAKGALVKESMHQLQQGVTQLPFAMDGLPQGNYSLRATWNDEVKTIKLIKE
jgi:dienelactone hydrolase